MPSWKKVITSGSAAALQSLTVTGGITGSLFGTASFALTSSFLGSTTNAFIQNGNSFGTTALLGTNDNQSLALETSGSTRMFISSSGNIGIGTTSPLGIVHLYQPAATTRMVMDGDTGQSKIITFRTHGLQRFGLYCNSTAESGANAGSDFVFQLKADATIKLVHYARDDGCVQTPTFTFK
jgi:hypothetical protein